ncbi:hypothetical protein [Fibrivirga algicola]|uniref:Addiction module protein n=1 Tax=Fibrivirga algicola TaxID=2950420 RepID=A0ABX0QBU3_9BACT|nr:hypothetical protein [Fibrivirga algicola]ARK09232.1 hypothetical protein A6C57_02210 [Fibrella sp. ES10-3-2-2]NID08655.1 hypothetical protein [Fibrivirga algicola]
MSVDEIEAAMQALTIDELAHIRDKAVELHQTRWEAQLAIDLESGRLDAWIDETKQDIRKAETRDV